MSNDKSSVWSASVREEFLALAYFVAGLQAWSAGIRWLACLLWVKAGMDTCCAIVAAIVEAMRDVAAKKTGKDGAK